MNQKLTEALTNLLQSAVAGKDFAVEQAPDVVQQLITYTIITHLGLFILGLATIIGSAYAGWVYFEKSDGVSAFFASFTGIGGLVMVIEGSTWIKVWLAPKLFVLEYAASLVK